LLAALEKDDGDLLLLGLVVSWSPPFLALAIRSLV
jgi:hypothetical protein